MRRGPSFNVVVWLALALNVQAAIMSIDFGSNFVKVGMVQKGKPFHIIVDETSKRKSPSIVAFDDGERRFGNGAKSLVIRKPKQSFERFRNLLGVNENSPAVSYFKAGGYPLELKTSKDGRGVLSVPAPIKSSDEDGKTFSIEQLVAMNLEYIKKIGEADAEEPVVDAVIAVPSYWNADQRQAMLDAGELAGLNVISLVNENTAAAVQYGIDINYKANMSEHLCIYNMGDGSTQVSVVKYSAYTKKRGSSEKVIGQLEIVASAHDMTLGGNAFDRVIASKLMDEFNELASKKGNAGYEIREHPKAVAKVRAQANKIKHVLSANQEVPIYIESLALDLDFKSHMTREQFYELAAPLLERAVVPLNDALKAADLTADDLKTTLIIGGSVRIPAVQAELKKALKSDDALGHRLDGDESVALGAAFIAANLSTAFRVRPIGLIDRAFQPIQIEIDSPERESSEENPSAAADAFHKSVKLFTPGSRLGSKKKVSFTHDRDIEIKAKYYDVAANDDNGSSGDGADDDNDDDAIALFNVTGVAKALSKVQNRTDEDPKISLSFRLTGSGTLEIVNAYASVQRTQVIVKSKKSSSTKIKKDALKDMLNQDKNFTRCESSDNSCSSCKYYATPCKTFSECTKEDKAANATGDDDDNSAKNKNSKLGFVLRLALSEGQTCQYRAAEEGGDEEDAGCYTKQDQPCYQVVEAEEEGEEENKEAAQDEQEEGSKGGDSANPDEEAASSSSSSNETSTAAVDEKDEDEAVKTKLVWTRKNLKTKYVAFGTVKRLSRKQMQEEKSMLEALSEADEEKQRIAASKNKLEGYVYSARGVLRDEVGEEVTTEEEREELLEKLEAAEDWLYEQEVEDDSVEKFEGKYKELKGLMASVEHRASEYEKRPEAIEKIKEILAESDKWVGKLKNRSWIKKDDVNGLEDKIIKLSDWTDEAEKKQAETPLTEAPYFNSSTAYSKLQNVIKAAERLLSKKKPKAPPKPLDYVRCETGVNKTACGRCTHYASGCYSFDTCKTNNTRYALYGKSKCSYSKAEKGCVYSATKDTLLAYPCYKGVPKKKNTAKAKNADKSKEANATADDPAAPNTADGDDTATDGANADEDTPPSSSSSGSSDESSAEDPEKDEL